MSKSIIAAAAAKRLSKYRIVSSNVLSSFTALVRKSAAGRRDAVRQKQKTSRARHPAFALQFTQERNSSFSEARLSYLNCTLYTEAVVHVFAVRLYTECTVVTVVESIGVFFCSLQPLEVRTSQCRCCMAAAVHAVQIHYPNLWNSTKC